MNLKYLYIGGSILVVAIIASLLFIGHPLGTPTGDEQVIAAITPAPAGCWVYRFNASNPFPNPATGGMAIKEQVELLVLDTNGYLHPAQLFSEVYDPSGQWISRYNLGSHASNFSFAVTVWTPDLETSNGTYTIKTWAQSSLCGTFPKIVRTVDIESTNPTPTPTPTLEPEEP
jgi:hypothetical protein